MSMVTGRPRLPGSKLRHGNSPWPSGNPSRSDGHGERSAAPPSSPKAELPECPMCLCPFDAASVVPRLLPCGHSLCGSCISSLPPASVLPAVASSLRCPLCSQCVPFFRALGPSSLPKKFDLLPSLPNPSQARSGVAAAHHLPLPLHAAHSRLLARFRFRYAVLPKPASPLQSAPPGPALAGLVFGSIASDLGAPWFCSRGHAVSLLPVEAPAGGAAPSQDAAFYRPSHAARVVSTIDALSGAAREEMVDLVAASARLAWRVCIVYDTWMGPEDFPSCWRRRGATSWKW